MSNKVQEINFWKGVVSHPNSISVGEGTFRDIKNGWHLRDGIVDKRPGFSIDLNAPVAPGLLSQFTGLKTVGDYTFVRQDNLLGVYTPGGGVVMLSGADTIDMFQCVCVKVLPDPTHPGRLYMYIGKELTAGTKTEPFIMVFSLTTEIAGQQIGQYIGGLSDSGTSTTPKCAGIDVLPGLAGSYSLIFSRVDTNKIYQWDLNVVTPGVVAIAGNGSAGFGTGSGTTSHALGPINGIKYRNDTGVKHIYACVSNGIADINLTGNSIALIAGGTSPGSANGTGAAASFNAPLDLDYFSASPTVLYVADSGNNSIRIVQTNGVVTTRTLTGGTIGTPKGIACLSPASGSSQASLLYVSDNGHDRIVSINPSTGALVVVGGNGSSGYVDGAANNAEFLGNYGLCVWQDANDAGAALSSNFRVLVADYSANVIRCLDLGNAIGTVSTFVGNNAGGYQKNNLSGFIGGYLPVPSQNPTGAIVPIEPQSQDFGEFGFSMFELNSTIYMNTNRGVVAFDTATLQTSATSNIIRYAGAPVGYDLLLTLVGAPGTLLLADYAVGYRMVWGYKTAAGKTILGAPSSLSIIANPSGAGSSKDVQIVSLIPPGVDTTWTCQLYRTLTNFVNTASGDPVPPGDTEFLVFESSPTLANLAAASITITDSTPDSLVGAALYTNATQETLSQANYPPPVCLDMCLFNGMAIYANTLQKQIAFINLVGVSGTFTVTVNAGFNITLTGNAATEDPTIGQFKYFTGGTPAANIQNTAQSIVRTFNGYPLNTVVFAQYTSAYNGTPGQISLTAKNFGQSTFYLSSTGSFSPTLPPGSGTLTYGSVAETVPNGLYVSKPLQPDAVPLVNNFQVGSSSEAIFRVLPLRTSCIIVKERSIWRLTGDDPSGITISLLDNTVSLRSYHSVSLLNNEVYALSTQGVVAISDNGVRIVSRDIEFELTQITGALQAPMDLVNCCWGFGSDDWRVYFLSIFQTESQAVTWCYSPFSNAWARWDLICYATTVTDGQIISACISDPNATSIFKAQKPYLISQKNVPLIQNALSYADDGGTSKITSVNGNVVSIDYVGFLAPINWYYHAVSAVPMAGWVLYKSGKYYYVLSHDSGFLTLNDAFGLLVNDVVTVYRPIDFFLRCNPVTAGTTFTAKQWNDFVVALESRNAYQFTLGFLQNVSPEGTAFLMLTKVLDQLQPGVTQGIFNPNDAGLYLEQVQRFTIPKQVVWGNILEWTLEHSEAFCELVVKAVGLETRGIESTKVQQ